MAPAGILSLFAIDFVRVLLHLVVAFAQFRFLAAEICLDSFSAPLDDRTLDGQVVVFTGKLSSLGRKEAQALVVRLGASAADEVTARTTMLVVGSEGFPGAAGREPRDDPPENGEKSNKIRKAEQLNRKGLGRIRIVSEDQFCELVGVPSPETLKQQYYALRDVLGMYPTVREDHLRYLQKFGLIQPVFRTNAETYVRFSDLLVIRQAGAELEQGTPFRAVLRSLEASRAGQLALNFRLDAEPAKIIKLRKAARSSGPAAPPPSERTTASPLFVPIPSEAEEYFIKGSMLDEGSAADQEAAAAAYRRALEVDPYLVAALINLGNIHYAHDELAEAQALYERAIGLEPDFFEAYFNLGNIYHDRGEYQEAVVCYRRALSLNARYPEAHFYLAVTFEKMGHSQEAKPHWRSYQQLAPDGEWVELAREFSE